MLFTTLLNQIKREGDFTASTSYDDMILDFVNEVATEIAKKINLSEYLLGNQSLTLTAGVESTSLPSGFLRLAGNRIFYLQNGTSNRFRLSPATLTTSRDFNGYPSTFRVTGSNLSIYPYQNIGVGDTAIFDYFKKFTEIASNGTLPDTFNTVCKQGALMRLLSFKDSARAQIHAGLYKDAFTSITANGAIS